MHLVDSYAVQFLCHSGEMAHNVRQKDRCMSFTTITRALLVFAALLFLTDKATACTCIGPRQRDGFHPVMVYWSADAVFTGLVTELSFEPLDANGKPARFSEMVVHLSVDQAFKGIQGPTVEIRTNPSTPSCGYDFQKGQRYFVYARQRGKTPS